MAKTTTDTDKFPAGTKEERVKNEQQSSLDAGAVKSSYSGSEAEGWVLKTTWNVIGEQ